MVRPTVKVVTLGRFAIVRDGKALRYGRKAPERPLLLLKYLAANGGSVPDAQAAACLWPEKREAALRTLAVNVHRLRHVLGGPATLVYRHRHLGLDARFVWCDAIAFERSLDRIEAEANGGRIRSAERALALYGGDFLAQEAPHRWVLAARGRLRARFVRACAAQGALLAAAGKWVEARDVYRRGIEVDDIAEDLCLGLMGCLAALDRPVDGVAAFRRLERSLAGAGDAPARVTRSLYRKLLLQES